MPDNSSQKILWLVRHGLRIDFADPEWVASAENPYNPPLDPTGLEQAAETAERLKSESIEHIFVSPFLRTLQTASLVAEKSGIEIKVEAGLSEWLTPNEFDQLPDLNNPTDLLKAFPLVNADYQSLFNPDYPEDQEALNTRMSKTISGIIDKYGSNILIVSHGSPIQSIHKALLNDVPDSMQPMGSVTKLEYSSGKWNLIINGDSSHLSSPDTSQRGFWRILREQL